MGERSFGCALFHTNNNNFLLKNNIKQDKRTIENGSLPRGLCQRGESTIPTYLWKDSYGILHRCECCIH